MTAPELVYGDDLPLGEVLDLGTHTVQDGEIVDFASRWDPLAIHTDAEIAAGGPFGGLIASGIHTAAILQRLAVSSHYSRWAIVAGREIRSMRMLRPVRTGDTLAGSLIPVSRTAAARGRVDVLLEARLANQDGKDVLALEIEIVMLARPAQDQL